MEAGIWLALLPALPFTSRRLGDVELCFAVLSALLCPRPLREGQPPPPPPSKNLWHRAWIGELERVRIPLCHLTALLDPRQVTYFPLEANDRNKPTVTGALWACLTAKRRS